MTEVNAVLSVVALAVSVYALVEALRARAATRKLRDRANP